MSVDRIHDVYMNYILYNFKKPKTSYNIILSVKELAFLNSDLILMLVLKHIVEDATGGFSNRYITSLVMRYLLGYCFNSLL